MRRCLICDTGETYKSFRGVENWYKYNNGHICQNCYSELKRNNIKIVKNIVTLNDRFWSKVDKKGEDECWNWMFSKFPNGYGQFKLYDIMVGAHRVAYELTYGKILNDLFVLHKCDNKKCCNPKHLFLGTTYDNMRDMHRKGKWKSGNHNGHTYTRGELNGNSKLTIEQVKLIRSSYNDKLYSKSELSVIYKVGITQISRIINNTRWCEKCS